MPERRALRRRRLSLTSLIDVIFLLLLFFMLSSTFSRHDEIALFTGTQGGGPAVSAPLFVQLGAEALTLNGRAATLVDLPQALADLVPEDGTPVLVSLRGAVTSQRLADLLTVLRAVPGLVVRVLD